jgi:hypothetical protein
LRGSHCWFDFLLKLSGNDIGNLYILVSNRSSFQLLPRSSF